MSRKIISLHAFLVLLSVVLLLSPCAGCGGKKKKGEKKDYGKPTWLKVDKEKLPKLSEYETTLESGTVVVYDPVGWERLSPGSAKPPKGFKSVIVFKKDGATLMMTKSQDAREMPDLDDDNIAEFAEAAQQRFKTAVKMIRLGKTVGVYFSRPVADSQRLSKFFDRRIVATSINSRLFTYELIADKGKIDAAMRDTLFAFIAQAQIEGADSGDDSSEASSMAASESVKTTETEVAVTAAPEPEKPVAAPKVEPVEVVAAPVEPKKPEPKVAATEPEAKPKPEPKKPEKKPAKKGNTKDILNALDDLLN